MSYQALYREWRPQTFSDLVGQPHVKQTLTNAISRGQVAHAYLFCGPRGTGKTSAAKILAKAINCRHPIGVEPCNECDACVSVTAGHNVDVEEIDAASNRGVDEIRQLRDKVQYAPTNLKRKVYIVDEVHMLTTEAFNALLKTLEEPPGHTLFVLATTEPHKIPATIVSRCQRFDFRRISAEDIHGRLERVCVEKNWRFDPDALWKIADAADGGMRDALGLLEQTAAFGQGEITPEHAAHVVGGVQTAALLELVTALVNRDPGKCLDILMAWYQEGKDPSRIVQELLQVLRDLFIVKLTEGGAADGRYTLHKNVAAACHTEWLLSAVKQLGEAYMHLRFVDQPRLALETAVLSLIPPASGLGAAAGMASAGTANAAAGSAGSAPNTKATAKARVPAARRKMEVLADLQRQAQPAVLQAVEEKWQDILQILKRDRIQTYGTMVYGRAVLATDEVVVLAFGSAVLRDRVMKPAERAAIESAVMEALQRPLRILALLETDWEAFQKAQAEPAPSPEQGDLVTRTIALFGRDVVEVRDEE
ncbi:MAG: DNA polymerase III subunit gamma/tau [Alicyclobacillus sp.]|nr:DNA polymerase III subunit gamma/tau [Alicyclobacillus sp.]